MYYFWGGHLRFGYICFLLANVFYLEDHLAFGEIQYYPNICLYDCRILKNLSFYLFSVLDLSKVTVNIICVIILPVHSVDVFNANRPN